ncbi:MAG TPA: hypothetical protein VJ276_12135 [Thermoanaerobaculia bacterium]|nr:hypothetical protein [Thermoanaerobaculia bacterium]
MRRSERYNPAILYREVVNPLLRDLRQLEPQQRRKLRQLCFWMLFVYLEWTYFEVAILPLVAGAAAGGLLLLHPSLRTRPSFVVLHAAILGGLAVGWLATSDWHVLLDFELLGALAVLELLHRKTALLLLLAAEHGAAAATGGFTPLAIARVFAVIMLLAIVVRRRMPVVFEEQKPVPPPPAPPRTKPMTVAQWEARNPPR